ncbi:hypothetical protein [uncultured Bacteroides sp.]|uniref:hypothetical protein n=1 Tax=uncultured Bacteroides sp. TaxID=162156 RepID=UPI002AABDEAC|nr:hypothetical protein [uncultured Bacteroides sp.]
MKKNIKIFLFLIISLGSAISFSQNVSGYKWDNVKIGGGGFVNAVIACPTQKNLFYARTDVGGAFRWEEKTQSWIPLLDFSDYEYRAYYGVESLAIDPQEPNRVYMSVGLYNWNHSAILRSDDYGKTFSATESPFAINGNGMGRQTGERLAVDPNKGEILFCGSRLKGLWKSTDRGVLWNHVTSFPYSTSSTNTTDENGVCVVVFDKNSSTKGNATQTIYVGVASSTNPMYVSKDGGATWNALPAFVGAGIGLMMQRAELTEDAKTLYVTCADGPGPHNYNKGAVLKYDVTTSKWTDITPSSSSRPYCGLSIDTKNNNRVLVSGCQQFQANQFWMDAPNTDLWGDNVYLTENGGTSWTTFFNYKNSDKMILDPNGSPWVKGSTLHWCGSIAFDPFNSSRFFITSGNGIYMSDNLITTSQVVVKFVVSGLDETVPFEFVSIPGGNFASVVGDYDGFIHTDVAQYPSNRYSPAMGTTTGLAFAWNKKNFMVRVGSSFYYSTDDGSTWTVSNMPTTGAKEGKVAISTSGTKVMYCPSASTNVYISYNSGKGWTNVLSGITAGKPVADGVNDNIFYFYDSGSGNLYKMGTGMPPSMVVAGSIGKGASSFIAVNPYAEGDLWIPMNGGGLLNYNVLTATKNTISNVTCSAVALGKAAIGKNYPTIFIYGKVDGVEGLFRSIDKGATWIRVNDDNHNYGGLGNGNMICGDWNHFGRVYMSTPGRGIEYGYLSDEGTGIENHSEDSFSSNSYIFDNSISFNFDEEVSYTVYSLSGQTVESGIGSSLNIGSKLVSGLYIMTLKGTKSYKPFRLIKK